MSWHPALLAILLVFCAPRPAFAETDCTLVRAVVEYVEKELPDSKLPILIVVDNGVGNVDRPGNCRLPRVMSEPPRAGKMLRVRLVRRVDGAIGLFVEEDVEWRDNTLGFRVWGVIRWAGMGWSIAKEDLGPSLAQMAEGLRDGGVGAPDGGSGR